MERTLQVVAESIIHNLVVLGEEGEIEETLLNLGLNRENWSRAETS